MNNLVKRVTTLTQRNLSKDIVALYLRGSAARDEWVPGLSDIDFYIVVQNEVLRNISSQNLFRRKLNPIIDKLSLEWPENKTSFKVVPLERLSMNPVGSYLTGVDAQLLLGLHVLRQLPPPSSPDLSRFGVAEFERFSNYWIKRASEGRVLCSLSEEAAYQDYVVLKLAQTALLTRKSLKVRKQEIADSFRNEFADSGLTQIVDEAERLRMTWPKPVREDMIGFVKEAASFPQALRNHLLMKNRFQNSRCEKVER